MAAVACCLTMRSGTAFVFAFVFRFPGLVLRGAVARRILGNCVSIGLAVIGFLCMARIRCMAGIRFVNCRFVRVRCVFLFYIFSGLGETGKASHPTKRQ